MYLLKQVGEASSSKWKGRDGLLKEITARKARALSKYEASQSMSKPQKSRPAVMRERHFNGVDLAPHRSPALLDALPIGTLHPMNDGGRGRKADAADLFALQAPASIPTKSPLNAAGAGFAASQLAMTGPHRLLGIATRLRGAPSELSKQFLPEGEGDCPLDAVQESDFVLPPGVRAGGAASELQAFAARAAENVTARLAGSDVRTTVLPFSDGMEFGSDESFESCEFSVAGVKFAVDRAEWSSTCALPSCSRLYYHHTQCHARHATKARS